MEAANKDEATEKALEEIGDVELRVDRLIEGEDQVEQIEEYTDV